MAQFLGWIATILFSLMIIPQFIKTLKLKTVKGVSLSFFITCLIANIIALIYATMIWQIPLILKYSFAIFTTIIYIILFFRIRRKENVINIK